MNKFALALMTTLFLVGCASTGSSPLPEIAPYDEPAYEPLPSMVPAE